jgi:hypothetical protein
VGGMDIAMAVGHATEATEDDRDISARGLFVLELSNQPLQRTVGWLQSTIAPSRPPSLLGKQAAQTAVPVCPARVP